MVALSPPRAAQAEGAARPCPPLPPPRCAASLPASARSGLDVVAAGGFIAAAAAILGVGEPAKGEGTCLSCAAVSALPAASGRRAGRGQHRGAVPRRGRVMARPDVPPRAAAGHSPPFSSPARRVVTDLSCERASPSQVPDTHRCRALRQLVAQRWGGHGAPLRGEVSPWSLCNGRAELRCTEPFLLSNISDLVISRHRIKGGVVQPM